MFRVRGSKTRSDGPGIAMHLRTKKRVELSRIYQYSRKSQIYVTEARARTQTRTDVLPVHVHCKEGGEMVDEIIEVKNEA